MNWTEYSERFGETKAEHMAQPDGDPCGGGECRRYKETGTVDLCDRHAETGEIEGGDNEARHRDEGQGPTLKCDGCEQEFFPVGEEVVAHERGERVVCPDCSNHDGEGHYSGCVCLDCATGGRLQS